jgi:hypothetical protein
MESILCSREETFDQLLLEIVDETLSCLGKPIRELIYFHLENRFNLRKDEIPHRLSDCASALELLLGFGASILEDRIMRRLHAKTCCTIKRSAPEHVEFPVYVEMLRTNFLVETKGESEITLIVDLEENPLVLVRSEGRGGSNLSSYSSS